MSDKVTDFYKAIDRLIDNWSKGSTAQIYLVRDLVAAMFKVYPERSPNDVEAERARLCHKFLEMLKRWDKVDEALRDHWMEELAEEAAKHRTEPAEQDSPDFEPDALGAFAARGFERVNRHVEPDRCTLCDRENCQRDKVNHERGCDPTGPHFGPPCPGCQAEHDCEVNRIDWRALALKRRDVVDQIITGLTQQAKTAWKTGDIRGSDALTAALEEIRALYAGNVAPLRYKVEMPPSLAPGEHVFKVKTVAADDRSVVIELEVVKP